MALHSDAARFLAAAFVTLVSGVVLVLVSFWLQIGHDTVDSAGRCRSVEEKVDLAVRLPSPKIVFVGGSSVHWGIDAEQAGVALGREGMNFGTFAALGPELILWSAKQALRPGDTVLLAFEYSMYAERNLTSDAISFALGCGRDYLAALTPSEWGKIAFAADPVRPLQVLFWEMEDAPPQTRPSEAPERSAHGDPVAASFKGEASEAMKERLALYQPLSIRVEEDGRLVRALLNFRVWAKRNDVRVYATWPNTIWFDAYRNDPAFDQIRDLYRRLDIEMIGEPRLAMYAADLFYDTQYHLSEAGIAQRTNDLLPVLKARLGAAGDVRSRASGEGAIPRDVRQAAGAANIAQR